MILFLPCTFYLSVFPTIIYLILIERKTLRNTLISSILRQIDTMSVIRSFTPHFRRRHWLCSTNSLLALLTPWRLWWSNYLTIFLFIGSIRNLRIICSTMCTRTVKLYVYSSSASSTPSKYINLNNSWIPFHLYVTLQSNFHSIFSKTHSYSWNILDFVDFRIRWVRHSRPSSRFLCYRWLQSSLEPHLNLPSNNDSCCSFNRS